MPRRESSVFTAPLWRIRVARFCYHKLHLNFFFMNQEENRIFFFTTKKFQLLRLFWFCRRNERQQRDKERSCTKSKRDGPNMKHWPHRHHPQYTSQHHATCCHVNVLHVSVLPVRIGPTNNEGKIPADETKDSEDDVGQQQDRMKNFLGVEHDTVNVGCKQDEASDGTDGSIL